MPKKPDLIPQTQFGHLTVLSKSTKIYANGKSAYLCNCNCGAVLVVRRGDLISGKSTTCGWCIFRKRKSILPDGRHSFNVLFSGTKKNAEARGLEFYLSKEQHKQLICQDCAYCGAAPKDFSVYQRSDGSLKRIKLPKTESALQSSWVKANGIDRIDSEKGYRIDNCLPCCFKCNIAKHTHSSEDFIDHCRKVVAFQNSKKLLKAV